MRRQMSTMMFQWSAAAVLTAAVPLLMSPVKAQETPPEVESFLLEGRLAEGAQAMQKRLDADPNDQQAGFSLGVVQFLQAIEGLGQDHYRYGLLAGRSRSIPLLRLPIPENKRAEQISYDKARAILQKFVDRLKAAEQTLAGVEPENVRLPLKLGAVHLDLNGDGEVSDRESMWHITQSLQRPRNPPKPGPPQDFPIVFDAGDVPWLRGYCHALSAVCEIALAYNWQDQFERTAHLLYPNVETPYEFLAAEGTGPFMGFGPQNVFDIVAFLHTMNYPVEEPERLKKALTHMEIVIHLSRASWKLIEAETDDEREWVPNDRQTSVMSGFTVVRNTISGWHEFLDEMEAILQGKKLVPFWRGVQGSALISGRMPVNPKLGINVRRIFTEPTRFDLALWVQGTALLPYLEEGEISSPEDWNRILRNFRGNFVNFFFWFN